MDQKLLLLINHEWTHPWMDRFMAVMSSFDFWIPFLAAVFLIVALWAGFRGRAFLVTACLIVAFNDAVIGNSLKHTFQRLRPHEALSGIRHLDLAHVNPRLFALAKPLKIVDSVAVPDHGQGRSFPSNHALDTVTIATLLALFYRRFGWIAFVVPLVVGYSRVYVGSHWPSDVASSLILGTVSTLLLAFLANRFWEKYGGRFWPSLHDRHPSLFTAS